MPFLKLQLIVKADPFETTLPAAGLVTCPVAVVVGRVGQELPPPLLLVVK
jgi:hypothetical protein